MRPVSDSSTTVDQDDFDWDEILDLKDTTDTDFVSQNADSDTESVRQVIKYIQKEAKVYRTGIKYNRPKAWSSTRKCLYEWDMVDRFLYNSIYFEIPLMMLITANMYCLPKFGIKM